MSLHFQIDLAFDFKEDVSEEIIFALQRLSDKQTLNVELSCPDTVRTSYSSN